MHQIAFEWPTPPYFHFDEDHSPEADTCLIYLRDGTKMLGEHVRFLPDDSCITYLSTLSKNQEITHLNDVKSMRLVKSLVLHKHPTSLESRTDELYSASERQPYTVGFIDKEVIHGDTISFASSTLGLYLFLPAEDNRIIRCFIPHQAINNYQIGKKIGEILIEEKLVNKDDIEAALNHQEDLRKQKIGDYLSDHQIITREQLDEAIRYQESQPILKLGEVLRQLNLISEAQLEEALAKQKANRNVQLGQILVKMEVINDRTLKGVLAKKMGIPYVGLSKFNFDLNAIKLVNQTVAQKYTLMPLCLHDSSLIIALEDPLNTKALEYLRFVTQKKILPAMASREEIKAAIKNYYNKMEAMPYDSPPSNHRPDEYEFYSTSAQENKSGGLDAGSLTEKLFGESLEMDIPKEPIVESDSTLVQLINKMIMDAHEDGVSDIHIESYPGQQNTRVRFRKDGTLVPYFEIPANARNAMISRIKIMAQLDISERRKPQDGKINFQHFGPAKIELRVATIPTNNNLEDVVMRILASTKPLPLDRLGFSKNNQLNLQKIMQRPYGLVLVCGPTGSGKTTTLHSLLGSINSPGRKIWTAEDPVEITQVGLRQVQVNPKIGWTFAAAMRSFLRADPDVIMVGEMRDEETTKVAIEASLTGHLVLSTLHTNSAPESITRLLDLGMDPFNFADALLAVLAQRLAKALCSECKEAYEPDEAEIDELLQEYCHDTLLDKTDILREWQQEFRVKSRFQLYHAKGCNACSQTGYKGRIGLHELMVTDLAIKRLIQTKAPVSELVNGAIAAGMRTLKQDGICKLLQGHTDIAQVRTVSA